MTDYIKQELDKNCPECYALSSPVFDAIEERHKGWYCKECGTFDKAIGRESKLPMGIKK